jgi:hypothetical protein
MPVVRKPRVLTSRPFDQDLDLAAALLSRHRTCTKRGLGDQVSWGGLVPSGAPSVPPDRPALGSETCQKGLRLKSRIVWQEADDAKA